MWGEGPGQLALLTANFLKQSTFFKNTRDIFLLDLGCGYGRDAIYLAQNLPCHILALDSSSRAITMARAKLPQNLEKRVELLCWDFNRLTDRYDVIFVSNLYHLLKPDDRAALRDIIRRRLNRAGMLFLSTLSVKDPQHFGRGTPVGGEINTFYDEQYLHFSTRAELEGEFDFLHISGLFERNYVEMRTGGNHHHTSWILMGKAP